MVNAANPVINIILNALGVILVFITGFVIGRYIKIYTEERLIDEIVNEDLEVLKKEIELIKDLVKRPEDS